MEKISGKFFERGKYSISLNISFTTFFIGIMLLPIITTAQTEMGQAYIPILVLSLILTFGGIILFGFAVFFFLYCFTMQFEVKNGKIIIHTFKFGSEKPQIIADAWDVNLLNIFHRGGSRLVIAINLKTNNGSFTIAEVIEDQTNPGYPIISCRDVFCEKYSSVTPGTIASVVKLLEGKKNPQLTAQESFEKYY